MAVNGGPATFTGGTGVKSIAIGMTPTWMEIEFGSSSIRHSTGYIYGGNQYSYPDYNSSLTSGKAIQVKDNSGTVILEGTWTGFSSNNANFNITTAPATMPQMLLKFGN